MSSFAPHRLEIDADPATIRAAVARQVESWGAEWKPALEDSGGRLDLPVLAGVRYGRVAGTVTLEPLAEDRSRLTFEADEEQFRLQPQAAAFLALAGGGALILLLAPFFRQLWAFVPMAVLLTLAGWLFIAARLRNSGPEEFFDTLAEELEAGQDPTKIEE